MRPPVRAGALATQKAARRAEGAIRRQGSADSPFHPAFRPVSGADARIRAALVGRGSELCDRLLRGPSDGEGAPPRAAGAFGPGAGVHSLGRRFRRGRARPRSSRFRGSRAPGARRPFPPPCKARAERRRSRRGPIFLRRLAGGSPTTWSSGCRPCSRGRGVAKGALARASRAFCPTGRRRGRTFLPGRPRCCARSGRRKRPRSDEAVWRGRQTCGPIDEAPDGPAGLADLRADGAGGLMRPIARRGRRGRRVDLIANCGGFVQIRTCLDRGGTIPGRYLCT